MAKTLVVQIGDISPSLHFLGGTEEGVRRALSIFLDELKVFRIVKRTRNVALPEQDCSRLGTALLPPGMDLVVGRQMADFQGIELVLGPVSLDRYFDFTERKASLLRRVLELVLPFSSGRGRGVILDQLASGRFTVDAKDWNL